MLDARAAVTFELEVIILSDEQLGAVHDLPILAFDLLDCDSGTFEGIEAPIATDDPRYRQVGRRADPNVRLPR